MRQIENAWNGESGYWKSIMKWVSSVLPNCNNTLSSKTRWWEAETFDFIYHVRQRFGSFSQKPSVLCRGSSKRMLAPLIINNSKPYLLFFITLIPFWSFIGVHFESFSFSALVIMHNSFLFLESHHWNKWNKSAMLYTVWLETDNVSIRLHFWNQDFHLSRSRPEQTGLLRIVQ